VQEVSAGNNHKVLDFPIAEDRGITGINNQEKNGGNEMFYCINYSRVCYSFAQECFSFVFSC
jgi:hypothetical protein